MEFFDSHAHYNDEKFNEDKEEIIKFVYNEGVTKLTCAGYCLESSKKAIELSKKYDYIYATCGISPNDIEGIENKDLEKIENLAKTNKKIVAIGEIGLDYYWNKENKEKQKQIFIKQIEIANRLNLPIAIHTREAVMDTIDILKTQMPCKNKGVFHCCPLNMELIKEGLKLDYYISFAGPITFKNSKNAEQVIQYVPLNRIVIETDSPYLAPEPVRGTRNNSANLKYMVKKIAEVKKINEEEIARITYENACKLYGIK